MFDICSDINENDQHSHIHTPIEMDIPNIFHKLSWNVSSTSQT